MGIFLVGWQLLHWSIPLAVGISAGFLLLFLLPGIIRRDNKVVSANMNLLTTMLLGGFWHGANWNFIIWGVWHGLGLALHKIWLLATGRVLGSRHRKPWYRFLGIILTFHFVCVGWVFFRSADFDPATNDVQKALDMLHQIFYSMDFSVWPAFAGNYWPVLLMLGIAFLLHALPDSLADKMIGRFHRVPMIAYLLVFFGFVILYGYFKSAEPVMPIYLKF